LLPMICRRGGIDKHEIGKINILDSTTEFEISASAATAFEARIKRPDKDDNIRIVPLSGASKAEPSREKTPHERDYAKKRPRKPPHKGKSRNDKPYHGNEARHAGKPKRKAHLQRGVGTSRSTASG
jgi:ATP-dependent RNA helicase DeaD